MSLCLGREQREGEISPPPPHFLFSSFAGLSSLCDVCRLCLREVALRLLLSLSFSFSASLSLFFLFPLSPLLIHTILSLLFSTHSSLIPSFSRPSSELVCYELERASLCVCNSDLIAVNIMGMDVFQ